MMLNCSNDTANVESSIENVELEKKEIIEKAYFVDSKLFGGWGRVSNLNVGVRFTEQNLKEGVFFDSPGLNFGSGKEYFSTFKIGEDTYLEIIFKNKNGQIIDTTFQRYLFKGDTLWLDETKAVKNIELLGGVIVFDEFIKVEFVN